MNNLSPLIKVDEDKCVNCHQCISVCQEVTQLCNNGSLEHVEINADMCIGCGECIKACDHNARIIIDEYDEFITATQNEKEKMVAIVAPSIAANFPKEYERINGWLKDECGIEAVFDVSFGAELTVKSYLDYINENNPKCVIAQPCPVIVNYIQLYHPELLEYLAPADSPMLHTIKMIESFYSEYKNHKIVVISPCIGKKQEFEQTGYGHKTYNVTFKSLVKHFKTVDLYKYPKKGFDGPSAERAAGFSTPGGLLQTVLRELPNAREFTKKIEGPDQVYDYLDELKESIDKGYNPLLIDCLNCAAGCNYGTGVDKKDKSEQELAYNVRQKVKENKEFYENQKTIPQTTEKKTNKDTGVLKKIKNTFFSKQKNPKKEQKNMDFKEQTKLDETINKYHKDNLYTRSYKKLTHLNDILKPTSIENDKIFEKMKKNTEDDRKINCSSCGYNSCEVMAIAIHNGLNKPENCHYYKESIIENQKENAQSHIEEITAESQQLSAMAQELNASNELVVERSEDTANKAETGLEYLEDVQNLIKQLVEKLEGLDKITETITGIADETNLLALNARIEAAKLDGKTGGGFSVIADEVRKLSEKTAQEANQIVPYANEIKVELDKVHKEVQEVLEDFETSVDNSNEIVASTQEIGAVISQVNLSIQELSENSESFLKSINKDEEKVINLDGFNLNLLDIILVF